MTTLTRTGPRGETAATPAPSPTRHYPDPGIAGIGGVLRHHYAHGVGIAVAILLLLSLHADWLVPALGAFIVASILGVTTLAVVSSRVLGRLGRAHVAEDFFFRAAFVGWPVVLALVALAGTDRSSRGYHVEPVAVVGILVAMTMAATLTRRTGLAWLAVACASPLIGGLIVTAPSTSLLIVPVAMGLGGFLSLEARRVIDDHHEQRQGVTRVLVGLAAGDDSEDVAREVSSRIRQWGAFLAVGIVLFPDDASAVILGGDGPLSAGLGLDIRLPQDRADMLRARADDGPWVDLLPDGTTDGTYAGVLHEAGGRVAAFVPLAAGGTVTGLLVAVAGAPEDEAAARLTEALPALMEIGEVAGRLLAPALRTRERRQIENANLTSVIESGAFSIVFQPILELETRAVVGYEALARFVDGSPPDAWFGRAGDLGRAVELEAATFRAALVAARGLPPGRWLSLNASPALLLDVERVRDMIGIADRPLVVELSEREPVEDYFALRSAARSLRPAIRLAVDDAGAGFASLRHVVEVLPDFVKLDLGLVRGIDADPARRALLVGMSHFAREAGSVLVAEGIETNAELTTLQELGVELGQGYLLGRPVPADRLPSERAVA